MAYFSYDFAFSDVEATEVVGYLELEDPIAFGKFALSGSHPLQLNERFVGSAAETSPGKHGIL